MSGYEGDAEALARDAARVRGHGEDYAQAMDGLPTGARWGDNGLLSAFGQAWDAADHEMRRVGIGLAGTLTGTGDGLARVAASQRDTEAFIRQDIHTDGEAWA